MNYSGIYEYIENDIFLKRVLVLDDFDLEWKVTALVEKFRGVKLNGTGLFYVGKNVLDTTKI